jgi:hypothetical protein
MHFSIAIHSNTPLFRLGNEGFSFSELLVEYTKLHDIAPQTAVVFRKKIKGAPVKKRELIVQKRKYYLDGIHVSDVERRQAG